MILKSGSSTDRGRSNCTASFISRISSAFCPDEIRESWKQKHTNKDVIFQIFQRGIKVRNTQNTKEPRGILGKELVCVSGHHLFFLSVFNIVGDELDKLGAESPEGGVPMDHQLFLDPVTVFKIYRGYTAKGIYMSNLMLYTEVDLFCIQNAYTTSFTMHIVLSKFGAFNGKLHAGVKRFIIPLYAPTLNKWKIDVLYMRKYLCRSTFPYLGIFT